MRRPTGRPPGRPRTITPDQEQDIIHLFDLDYSMHDIARLTNHGIATVSRTIARSGRVSQQSRLERMRAAHAALQTFHTERQLQLIDTLAERVDEMAYRPDLPPKDLRDLSVSLGILVDKRRLIEGQSTSNTESHVTLYLPEKQPTRTAIPAPPAVPQLASPSIEMLPRTHTPAGVVRQGGEGEAGQGGGGGNDPHISGDKGSLVLRESPSDISPNKGTLVPRREPATILVDKGQPRSD